MYESCYDMKGCYDMGDIWSDIKVAMIWGNVVKYEENIHMYCYYETVLNCIEEIWNVHINNLFFNNIMLDTLINNKNTTSEKCTNVSFS
jgi:hypothetical protein